jgi:starch synthase
MAPFAKVGGLADVVTALARAHQAAGVLAEVILPKYGCMDYSRLDELRCVATVAVPWRDAAGGAVPTAVWTCVAEGLPVYLLEPLAPLGSGPGSAPAGPWSATPPFWRGGCLYGEADDTARFLFFGCAVLSFLDWSGRAPDVLHLHDWQAAAVAPLLEVRRRTGGGGETVNPAVVLSLHNMAFQGRLSPEALAAAPGLDPASTPAAGGVVAAMADAAGRTGPGGAVDANLLQGGIRFAHAVTTVSPTYAREVLGPDAGCGLERVLAAAAGDGKFSGVLNGIDTDAGGGPAGGSSGFDPAADPALPAHFTAAAPWPGKDACKRALLAELGFAPDEPVVAAPSDPSSSSSPVDPSSPQLFDDGAGGAHPGGRPLLAIVSRLSAQKGLDLMDAMVEEAVARGARVVVLGTAPDPADAARFAELAAAAEHGQDARYRLFFSDGLARRIYAGADALLVPSRYEPCGLAQLIALRYGTIPIVRRTGGLADTVTDIADGGGAPEARRNGVVFDAPEPGAARAAVRRALDAYRADGGGWWRGCLVPRAAAGDWSWARSAATYLDVYRRAVEAARGGG